MDISWLVIIINSVMLVLAFAVVAFLLQSGARYTYHYGDSPKQAELKWRILKLIILLISIGLVASVYNVIAPYFM